MSRAKLEAVPAPRDALIAALKSKLSRLFSGVVVRHVYGNWVRAVDTHCDYIDITFFGPEDDLVRHGLVTREMLGRIPSCGVKTFGRLPHLGNTGFIHVKRGKTGTRLNTSWWCRDEERRGAPPWIKSELRALAEMNSATAEPSDASTSQKKVLQPAEWKRIHANGFGIMIDLACRSALESDSYFDCLAPGCRIDSEDKRRFETRVGEVLAELKEQFLAIRIDGSDEPPRREAPVRRLSLVIDNT